MSHAERPFSPACERNQAAILAAMAPLLEKPGTLLEIGSGTGQHAAWMAPQLPHIRWQTSDLPDHLPGIQAWLDDVPGKRMPAPAVLDVAGRWPEKSFQYLYTANTFHIMASALVERCIEQGGCHLDAGGRWFVYGPFRVAGAFTSDSNHEFHHWLQQRDPRQGIRALEWVQGCMQHAGLELVARQPMPANNFLLTFEKTGGRAQSSNAAR